MNETYSSRVYKTLYVEDKVSPETLRIVQEADEELRDSRLNSIRLAVKVVKLERSIEHIQSELNRLLS